jgi:hypothetical protein
MRATEFITEAILDPSGWGNTPDGTDIDYFGLRVQMRPSTFLKLALPLTSSVTNPEVAKHMKTGGKIAYPMLGIEIPDEWRKGDFSQPAKVVDHEGRNRMKTWIELKGDDPIQVNIKPRGGLIRRRDLTDEYIKAMSTGLISQRGNLVQNPFDASTTLEEAEIRTPASKEIRTSLRRKGYKLLGSGVDATVWAKKTGPVIKIIMPEDHKGSGTAGDTFMKFYEFCRENQSIDNLPKFSNNEVELFTADNKEYVMVTMERLSSIPSGSFQEAMVWILSELATETMSWTKAITVIKDPNTWLLFDDGMDPKEVINTFNSLDKTSLLEYEILYKLMTLLYHRGKINKIGWDLHTENAMMRGNTIVITDPWFSMEIQ